MTRLDSITAVPIDKIRDLANSLAGKFIDLRWAMFTLPAEYDRNLLSKVLFNFLIFFIFSCLNSLRFIGQFGFF